MPASGKQIMVTSAYKHQGAKHSKLVIFWLGGWWKVPAWIVAGFVAGFAVVKGVQWVAGHWPSTGAFAISGGPAILVTSIAVGVVVVALLGHVGGGRSGRRR
jgi:hypothetical protein